MLKQYIKIFGIVMVFIGILGFIPGVTERDLFLGVFRVNPLLNFIHLGTGLLAYFSGRIGYALSRFMFQLVGVIYAFLGILGFAQSGKHILRVIANNMADSWLHVAVAVFCLFMGFFYKK